MRKLIAATILVLSGCAKLVSSSADDFSNGYATLYTTHNKSRSGETCNAGVITYYKRNILGGENWVRENTPYYAAPGTYRIAMWCQEQVDPKSGECQNTIYADSGGPESEVTLERNRTYVIYCKGHGVQVEDLDAFEKSRQQ